MTYRILTCLRTVLLGSLLTVAALAADTVKKTYHLPAGDAVEVLKQYAAISGRETLFATEVVRGVKTRPVDGELTAAEAIDALLADTELVAVIDPKSGAVAVRRKDSVAAEKNVESRRGTDAAAGVGSLDGLVMSEGRPVAGARVSVVGHSAFALTDRFGAFGLDAVPAGHRELVIDGEHIARVRVLDVVVKSDHAVSLATVNAPVRERGLLTGEEVKVPAQKLGEVLQIERFEVTASRPLPYAGANLDLPRTENDAQPYVIFESAEIESSGAVSVVDFFQRFVPMNYRKGALEQMPTATNGSTSIFSLFGPIGQDQTLVLVNGRVQANVRVGTATQQPDINGIPISAIDHIEILPASASAIYGASALGGVINVVLKQNYVGGELRVNYENVAGADAPNQSASLTSGMTFRDGKTHLFVTASYSERKPLKIGDRPFLLDYVRRSVTGAGGENDPLSPWLGATPNITTYDTTANLQLKEIYGGTDLGSPITSLPVGYQGVATDGVAALLANAGTYNNGFSASSASLSNNGYGLGLDFPLTQGATLRGFSANLRNALGENIEWYTNFDYRSNESSSTYGSSDGLLLELPASAPTSPFESDVYINVPIDNSRHGHESRSLTRDFVTGLKLTLPHDWTALTEYHYAENTFQYTGQLVWGSGLRADIASGEFDILRDLLSAGVDLSDYYGTDVSHNHTSLEEVSVRASGPVWDLPGGSIQATTLLGWRDQGIGYGETRTVFENYPNAYSLQITLPRSTTSTYAGMEVTVPVFGQAFTLPLVESLAAQIALRYDDYHAEQQAYTGNFTTTVTERDITSSESDYYSDNQTYGLTWKPVRDVMLRGSYSTAFTPPDASVMLPTVYGPYTTTIVDPLRDGERYTVSYQGSGNPDLQPETSENINLGVVLTPRWVPGLRLSADYVRVRRENSRGSLSAQALITNEAYFPDRVTRADPATGDPYGVGQVTFVDTRYLNLYQTESEAYNYRAGYQLRTANYGDWSFNATASVLQHYKQQATFAAPLVEMIGNQTQGSFLVPKFKGTFGLTWDRGPWTVGWNTRYYAEYPQWIYYVEAQGSDMLPSQTYHDVYVGYQFPSTGRDSSWRSWFNNTSVQIGAKNVFNTKPPYDASGGSGVPYSSYGDPRLASYWISLKRDF